MLRYGFQLSILLIFYFEFITCSPALTDLESKKALEVRKAKADEILSFMNTTVDACENFYEYSCGNYDDKFKDSVDTYAMYSPLYHIGHLMKDLITNHLSTTHTNDSEVDKKVKRFYKSCLNKPTTLSAYSAALKRLVSEFGHMPVLEGDNWREDRFDWSQVVAHINAKTDLSIILDNKIIPDSFDNTRARPSLRQQLAFTYAKKIYYVDDKFDNYRSIEKKKIRLRLQKFLNVDENLAQQTAEEIMNFEIALAQGMQDLELEKPNVLYNVTNMDEAQAQYLSTWNTIEYFTTALELYTNSVTLQPTYLNNLVDVIQRTPKKQVANYIFYKYLNAYMAVITIECKHIVRQYFMEYLENTMYHKLTTEQDRSYILFMWQEIKSSFADTLISNKANWMSDNTRQLALEKLKAMQLKFASYDHINFQQKYATLSLNDNNFLENLHAILMLRGKEAKEKSMQAPKFLDPPLDMLVYSPEENIVYISVAVLQTKTFWSTFYPFAINFGSIGTLMAHELTHGFDDVGRRFDKNGNFYNWWDNVSSQNFEDRKACIAIQYKSYTFRGVNLPDLENQCENISDNVGLQHAFKAYMNWYNKVPPTTRQNELLPDLPYNPKQLFFLSFSQTLGGAVSEKFVYDNDDHLPGEFRVKGSLDNMSEFARAFNCTQGSAMNPMNKCEIY